MYNNDTIGDGNKVLQNNCKNTKKEPINKTSIEISGKFACKFVQVDIRKLRKIVTTITPYVENNQEAEKALLEEYVYKSTMHHSK